MNVGTKAIHIKLPEALKQYADERVGEGEHFSTLSDYIRSLIRADQQQQGEQGLKQLLLDGLRSGSPVAMTRKAWNQLWAEVEGRVQTREKKR